MKKVLYVILKNSPEAHDILEELKSEGFNGTLIGSNSLRHAMEYYPEDHNFLNLRHLEDTSISESVLCMFVWDEEVINTIKEKVRQRTDNFLRIKGFMFSQDITDYEGTL